MKNFLAQFKHSALEFQKLRSLTVAALLVAVHTVMAFFLSFQITGSLRISLSFLANVLIGAMFGPVMGFACGAAGDLIQFVIKPTGPFFPGWTLNAALACMIYGMFFYHKYPSKAFDWKLWLRCSLVLLFDTLLVNVLLGTYWCTVMYGKGFWFYFSSRFAKNILQLPINIVLTYYMLLFAKRLKIKSSAN